MANQVKAGLQTQLEQLSDAELASLVIELVENEQVAVALGEVLYRRLAQTARRASAAKIMWYQPFAPVTALRRSSPT